MNITDENFNAVKQETQLQKMSFMAELGLVGGITMLHGREYINAEGLQYLAKKQGVRAQRVEVLEFASDPGAKSWAVKATVIDKDGNEFSDIGDAAPNNVGPAIKNATLRMACTRATNRALRKVLVGPGVAMTSAEELPAAGDSSDPDLKESGHAEEFEKFLSAAKDLGFADQKAIELYAISTGWPKGIDRYPVEDLRRMFKQMKSEVSGE